MIQLHFSRLFSVFGLMSAYLYQDLLKSNLDDLMNTIGAKDGKISDLQANGGHYMDNVTGGNGNTVENVSFTLGGMSLGMLALKYGVPFLLNRRRRRKNSRGKEVDEPEDDGYNNMEDGPSSAGPPLPRNESDGVQKHYHEHVHKHDNDFVMPPEELPEPRFTDELNPDFMPYGYKQACAAYSGLPPQLLNVPFSVRKKVSAEMIMTVWGELVNEYNGDHTMTPYQMDKLLRQRLKQRYNVE